MQPVIFRAQRLARRQHRFDIAHDQTHRSRPARARGARNFGFTVPSLRPKFLSTPRRSASMSSSLRLSSLRKVEQDLQPLAAVRLHMDRLKQADPHHLGNAACVIAIALVDGPRAQHGGRHAGAGSAQCGNAGLDHSAEKVLRQRSRLPSPLAADAPHKATRLCKVLRARTGLCAPEEWTRWHRQDAHTGLVQQDIQARIARHDRLRVLSCGPYSIQTIRRIPPSIVCIGHAQTPDCAIGPG